VRTADVRAFVRELKGLGFAVRDELEPRSAGPIVVSGVLAEQLAKELGAGAAPGAVVVATNADLASAAAHVRIVAGDPSPDDEALVAAAAYHGVEVVIVELWPQPDWTRPFVLSPFVVECRAGEGFPVAEISDRLVEAAEDPPVLAAQVPVIAAATRSWLVKRAVVRSAVIGFVGSRLGRSRPLLVLEQARLVSRLRAVSAGPAVSDELPVMAGSAAAVLASGFALRTAARSAGAVLPAPLVNAAVAAAGTWAFARSFRLLEERSGLLERADRERDAVAL
jgi:hypothetical protein